MDDKDRENGVAMFHEQGFMRIMWHHRDHDISLVIQSQYNSCGPTKNEIRILYMGDDVTSKYIEQMHDKHPVRIRTTLKNLVAITEIIDKNIELYIEEEMSNGG